MIRSVTVRKILSILFIARIREVYFFEQVIQLKIDYSIAIEYILTMSIICTVLFIINNGVEMSTIESPEIISSIVSLVAAACTAIFTFITTRSSKKRDNETQKHIELLRIDSVVKLEKLKIKAIKDTEKRLAEKVEKDEKILIVNERLDKKIDSLLSAIKQIQKVKSVIDIVLSSTKEGITVIDAIDYISAARQEIEISFTDHFSNLCKESEILYHKAKKISLHLPEIIDMYAKNKRYIYNISNDGREKFIQERDKLSDIQQELRDNSSSVLMERIKIND